jgi:hypothetical protein
MTRTETTHPVTMPAIRHVDVPDYPAAHSPYTHAVVANGFVFVSAQIPVRPGGGPTEVVGATMQEQTRGPAQRSDHPQSSRELARPRGEGHRAARTARPLPGNE